MARLTRWLDQSADAKEVGEEAAVGLPISIVRRQDRPNRRRTPPRSQSLKQGIVATFNDLSAVAPGRREVSASTAA